MKRAGFAMIFLLGMGVFFGCAEKKSEPETAREAPKQSAEAIVSSGAEKKEAAPVARPPVTEEKAAEKAAPAPAKKAASRPSVDSKTVEAGALIFKSKCSPCHGADANGTAMAPALKGNKWVREAANSEVAQVIRDGRQGSAKKYTNFAVGMPAAKGMPESDVNALAEYVKSMD